ncbi:MAG: outer membrane beta-barrel protein, partial [Bryobacteraceae bacterium]
MVEADPLAAKLADPDRPPRFEQADEKAETQNPAPPAFVPPASGAGVTGFDSTNIRKPPKAKTKRAEPAPNELTAPATAATPRLDTAAATEQPPPSPYNVPQIPPSGQAETALAAGPPGTPPVGDVGPIRKKPKRKPGSEPDDPFAPVGVGVGGIDLFPAVELIGGYDTNPGQAQNGKGAWLYSVAPELRAQSHWSRHELKADLRGSYTGFSPDQTPALSRPYVNGKVDGRIDVTSDTRVDLGSRVLVSTDNPGSPNLQAGLAKLPIFTSFGGNVGLGQRFNRFDLSVKGDAERTVYQNSELINGTTASNDDRNYDQYTGTLRGGYELLPGVVPFAEASADTRRHDLATDYSGYQRDSNG